MTHSLSTPFLLAVKHGDSHRITHLRIAIHVKDLFSKIWPFSHEFGLNLRISSPTRWVTALSPLCHSDRTAIQQEQTTCFFITCDSQWRQSQVGRQSNRNASYLSLPPTVPACCWLTVATMLKERHLLLTVYCVCMWVCSKQGSYTHSL